MLPTEIGERHRATLGARLWSESSYPLFLSVTIGKFLPTVSFRPKHLLEYFTNFEPPRCPMKHVCRPIFFLLCSSASLPANAQGLSAEYFVDLNGSHLQGQAVTKRVDP